jgi:bifunctional UDP-N-acetylglucosamine pyrophosphorylase/glucosamine-1-phosphate N-acetyltransferase
MTSARPKVMHEVGGRSLVGHVAAALAAAAFDEVAVVAGPDGGEVAKEARRWAPALSAFVQEERRGTAHAALQAREAIAKAGQVVVAFGDTPLMRADTFKAISAALDGGAAVAAVGFQAADPTGYGRFVMREGALQAIVEHKDASEAERAIRFCNAGVMGLSGAHALELLDSIGCDNAQGEYYLTDAVAAAVARGLRCAALDIAEEEVQGVNDRAQLAAVEKAFQTRARTAAMAAGATLIDPETVYFSYDTRLGRDVVVEPSVWFGPGVEVADGATIHAFSHLEGCKLASGASVGPFVRLRPGADLGQNVKVGNFVEIKNATLGEGAKASHLSYLGDASIGAQVNIGAGVITCNYDGYLKHKTVVGEGAFVGTNASLVAPVTVGAGALVAAGSVITKEVPADAVAITRPEQVNKPGAAAKFRARKAAEKAAKAAAKAAK